MSLNATLNLDSVKTGCWPVAVILCCSALAICVSSQRRQTAYSAQLPGPSFSDCLLQNLKEALSPTPSSKHTVWSTQFGPTYHYRTLLCQSRIYTTDRTAITSILQRHALFPKSKLSHRFFSLVLGYESALAETTDHKRQGRILRPFFEMKSIEGTLRVFFDKAEAMRDQLGGLIGGAGTVNVEQLAQRCTMDIIGKAGFDHELGALEDPEDELVMAFRGLIERTQGWNLRSGLAGLWRWGPRWALLEAKDNTAEEPDPDSNDAPPDGFKDLLSSCFRANKSIKLGNKDRLTEDELLGQVTKFILSVSDTSATAITWALYMLTCHPEVQHRLREDCLAVEEQRPSLAVINSLPYLEAVVRETLRLYPPVPATSRAAARDTVIPLGTPLRGKEGAAITELVIKKGTSVYIRTSHDSPPQMQADKPAIEEMNRLPELWGPDAKIFKPYRHLAPPPDAPHLGVYGDILTFLGGPRHCMRYRFALAEIKVILFVLIRGLRFALPDEEVVIVPMSGLVMRPGVVGQAEKEGAQMPLVVRSSGGQA